MSYPQTSLVQLCGLSTRNFGNHGEIFFLGVYDLHEQQLLQQGKILLLLNNPSKHLEV